MNKRIWKLVLYLILVFIALFSYFWLRDWWLESIRAVLNYYNEVSIIFTLFAIGTIPFRFYAVKKGKLRFRKRGFYFLGPFMSLALEPLAICSVFYVAIFMLRTFSQGVYSEELSIERSFIFLMVVGGLLYWSVYELYEMIREIL
jgi:hypothetical protein